MKTCSKCGETKPLAAFVIRRDSKQTHYAACRDCKRVGTKEAQARWRANHPERSRRLAREYTEQNREKERARWRRYDEEHREARRLAIAKSRAEDPEYYREIRRAWRERNLEISRARCRAYWHYKRTGSDPSPEIDKYAEYLLTLPCAYCGGEDEPITIDHVLPVSRGGKHTKANLAPACQSCNSSKGARTMDEWSGPPRAIAA